MKERIRGSNDDGDVDGRDQRRFNGGRNSKRKIKKRNMQRLGGRGLSLQVFANAKSGTKNDYNPAFIKKQREFYKNAMFVKKYKRSLRQQEQPQNDVPMATGDFEAKKEQRQRAEAQRKSLREKVFQKQSQDNR